MIKIDLEPLIKAVDSHADSRTRLAYFADVSPPTLEKILAGDMNVNVESIVKIATFLGLETGISFRPLREPAKAA